MYLLKSGGPVDDGISASFLFLFSLELKLDINERRRADMNFVKVMKKMFTVEPVEDDPDKPTWSRENLHL